MKSYYAYFLAQMKKKLFEVSRIDLLLNRYLGFKEITKIDSSRFQVSLNKMQLSPIMCNIF